MNWPDEAATTVPAVDGTSRLPIAIVPPARRVTMSSWLSEVWKTTGAPLRVGVPVVKLKAMSVDVLHTSTVLVVVDTLTHAYAGIAPDAVMIG